MSRKKHRYKDLQPKPVEQQTPSEPEAPEPEEDKNITRYKAVVRSPLGEWWHDNYKRVRLFALIAGGAIILGWLLFEFFSLIF